MPEPVVAIVGAGQAGFQTASSLRQEGFAGRILLIGDEPVLPYQRPPLSKSYLAGESGLDELWLRPENFYEKQRIDYLPGETVIAIDRPGRRLRLGSGRELACDHVVLATGARNRPLPVPGAELGGVMGLRTFADADTLRRRLAEARDVVVIGAGFIGLEFASVAIGAGAAVHILEVTQQPMGRVVSAPVSKFFTEAHRQWGATISLGAAASRICGGNGRATGVETSDGRRLPADLVIVCIGVLPNAELAAAAGLSVSNGIAVDDRLVTDDPAILAIGDCASYPTRFAEGRVRLEIGAERGRPGALRRRPDRREACRLRQGAVVLERPGRPQTADCRPRHRPRRCRRARRAGGPQLFGLLLPRRASRRRRVGQPPRRPHRRPPHPCRPALADPRPGRRPGLRPQGARGAQARLIQHRRAGWRFGARRFLDAAAFDRSFGRALLVPRTTWP